MAVASLFEELLDQYKIEQRLAEKRYTDLYRAYDVDDDRLARLDIVRPGPAEDNAFAGRFVNRARAVTQLRHPNIASIYHIGKTADGRPYVAQAHIDGISLAQRLEELARRETQVNALYALKLVRQLADALVLAERLELLHHDLQPDNVWLKNVALPSDESLVLLDLFIPPDRRPPPADDRDAYRSPEQRAGREVSAAGHVYSLGVLLYQLLSRQLPDGPVTLQEVSLGRLRARSSSLERARPGLSRQTYDLVERCLRREPGRRYESVEAFLVALDGALVAEEARLSLSVGQTMESRRPIGWLLPLLILALLVVAATVAARWQRQTVALAPPTSAIAAYPAAASPTPAASATFAPPTAAPTEPAPAAGQLPEPTAGAPMAAEATAAEALPVAPTATAPPTPTATIEPSPTAAPTRVPVVRITLNQVNLRRGPGVVFNAVGSLRSGDTLQVLAWNDDRQNPWYLVLTADQRLGWVSAEVVEADDANALAAVPVAATLPATPFPTSTARPLPTATAPTNIVGPTAEPGDGDPGDGDPGDPEPPPTAEPTEPATEPTPTPPPLP
jgi:serine/threonine-protein kinase